MRKRRIYSTVYECEICGRQSEDKRDVEWCEDRGRAALVPVGLILGARGDYTFAVATSEEDKEDPHERVDGLWATGPRDIEVDPSIYRDIRINLFKDNSANPTAPTFRRMVAFLEARGIPVTVWNGKEVVPLADFLAAHKEAA